MTAGNCKRPKLIQILKETKQNGSSRPSDEDGFVLLLIIASYSARCTFTCPAMHTRLLSVCDAAVWPLPALLSHLPLLASSHLESSAVLFVFTVCGAHSYLHVPTHARSSVLKPSFPPASLCPWFPHCLHSLTITFMTWCSYFVLLPPARASSRHSYRLLGSLIALP